MLICERFLGIPADALTVPKLKVISFETTIICRFYWYAVGCTSEIFGSVVDSNTMTKSVKDGIAVNLVYDEWAAKVTLNQSEVKEIEDYHTRCAVKGASIRLRRARKRWR